jgi:hypothetical protein
VHPFKLQPFLDVWSKEFGRQFYEMFKGCPYRKYSPEDMLKLEDPARLDKDHYFMAILRPYKSSYEIEWAEAK